MVINLVVLFCAHLLISCQVSLLAHPASSGLLGPQRPASEYKTRPQQCDGNTYGHRKTRKARDCLLVLQTQSHHSGRGGNHIPSRHPSFQRSEFHCTHNPRIDVKGLSVVHGIKKLSDPVHGLVRRLECCEWKFAWDERCRTAF